MKQLCDFMDDYFTSTHFNAPLPKWEDMPAVTDEREPEDAAEDAQDEKIKLALGTAITRRKDTNPKEGEKKYGDVKFADPKNKKYPIDTPEHVRSAASYFGKAHNRNEYSQEEQTIIDKRIRAAKKKFHIGDFSTEG
jgi:hypothetical protein